jgi:integrase
VSLHLTKNGKWEVRYREGSRNRGKGGFLKRKDAEEFDIEQKAKRLRGEQIIRAKDTPTLDEVAFALFARLESEGKAESTLILKSEIYDHHIGPYLGHLRVAEITPSRLEEWRQEAKASTPYMKNRAKGLISQIFNYAKKQRYIEVNYAADLSKFAHSERKALTASVDQVEAIRAYFLERDREGYATIVSVLAFVGLRPFESLALMWDMQRERRFFLPKEITKTKVARFPEIPGPVLADLARWKMSRGSPEGLIFPLTTGAKWRKTDYDNWRSRWFKKAAKDAGLPSDFRPYDLRHTCASLMLRAPMATIAGVAEHMGHSPQMLMQTYTHEIEAMRDQEPVPIESAIMVARSADVRRMSA